MFVDSEELLQYLTERIIHLMFNIRKSIWIYPNVCNQIFIYVSLFWKIRFIGFTFSYVSF